MKFKKVLLNLGKIIPALALVLGTASVSQACVLWFHQPVVPDKMRKEK